MKQTIFPPPTDVDKVVERLKALKLYGADVPGNEIPKILGAIAKLRSDIELLKEPKNVNGPV